MHLRNSDRFMMLSNSFLILPIIVAATYHEWLYCFFAFGVFVFSPLFHWYRIVKPSSILFWIFRCADWSFAIGAFIYMYHYTYRHTIAVTQMTLFALLTLVVIFFWYGWLRGSYSKLHPWFHIFASIVSTVILIVGNS